ncbi:PREDICTED: pirin-like [Amphimedon queenslandica]|uniref:Pirin C-terminal domain-containing protein n=1 Tax=Amphimedon queenslandica TaxID=400682 RepID=A0AAN0IQN4_AMPQE|nr:PREDICTED: pirin-like [Amphimedon queenslandica]|eukprot:XP_011407695.1 PREDICTED: pirin-like [Amphimedon queenslandica]
MAEKLKVFNYGLTSEQIPPRYQDTPPERIPVVTTPDGKGRVKVIAGESLRTSANIETQTPIMYLDIHLKEGASFTQSVPKKYKGILYVWRGSGYLKLVRVQKKLNVKKGQMGVMGERDSVTMTAADDEEMQVLLIAGEPLNKNVVRSGPFVINTWAEIQQAYSDYQSGKLGQIEGVEERYAATEAAKKRQKESGRWQGDL